MVSAAHLGGTGEPLPDELVLEPEVEPDPEPELDVLLVPELVVPEGLEEDPPVVVLVEPDDEPVEEPLVDDVPLVLVLLVVEPPVPVVVEELPLESPVAVEVPSPSSRSVVGRLAPVVALVVLGLDVWGPNMAPPPVPFGPPLRRALLTGDLTRSSATILLFVTSDAALGTVAWVDSGSAAGA